MKKVIIMVILCLGALGMTQTQRAEAQDRAAAQDSAEAPRVLMVVSGHGLDKGKKQPGYEFDELAQAYLIFRHNGLQVDIASPRGGAVEADEYNPDKVFVKAMQSDGEAMAKLTDTLALGKVRASDYRAVFVVGGKGAMFDLPTDGNLQALIGDIYEAQGVVAAVCHGPAALVDVKLRDGSYLVAGKAVNGFTNAEERAFGKKWVKHFPFLLQDKLIERGGLFEHSDMMLSHVASDSRLLTGQNPASTPMLAEALVAALGLEPRPRERDAEENTMALISDLWRGDWRGADAFRASAGGYQANLMAMYGHYQLQFAQSDAQLSKAVRLMELASVHFQHPRVSLSIADGHRQLGNKEQARRILQALLQETPDMQAALSMLKELQ